MGRVPASAWELGMAENGFMESFLEKVTHELYVKKFLEFSDGKSEGRCSLQQGWHLQRPRGRRSLVHWRAGPLLARAGGVECGCEDCHRREAKAGSQWAWDAGLRNLLLMLNGT